MRTQTVFVAIDGRQFNDRKQCEDHEERLFNAWLHERKNFKDFIQAGTVDDRDAERRAVVREYFEWCGGE